ncbi:MAG: uracil-DNA glycosylase [Lachnospiraceae bacterium]|nr:uracil-DNA glycosylase [Lachnospiraceae bacterium]
MYLLDYNIENGWKEFFDEQKKQDYYRNLASFVDEEYNNNTVYPPKENIFRAFELTDINDIKLVIIGQDPYHEAGQAMGLAFSVPKGVRKPPSLCNIYKEIEMEYDCRMPDSGDLTSWANEGIFLLNNVLTVREHEANSHKDSGWGIFTDNVIRYIDTIDRPICYMLWGNFARSKKEIINNPKAFILEAAHPSPLSASRGFFGCNHFQKYNAFLKKNYS